MEALNPYESPRMRSVTGPAIRPGGLELTERAMSFCRFTPEATVLDVGCGLGTTVDYLRKEHHLQAFGLDQSAPLLKEGKEKSPDLGLIRGKADSLPLPRRCLAGLFCECVLSLVDHPTRMLRECRRVLKPGGYLILADIYARNPIHIMRLRDLHVHCCARGAMDRDQVEHYVQYSGFSILVWEDHSIFLKRLAAQLVFEYGSMAAFWGTTCPGNDPAEVQPTVRQARLGYYLMVARREGENDG
jgi:arsenite methyltransferase